MMVMLSPEKKVVLHAEVEFEVENGKQWEPRFRAAKAGTPVLRGKRTSPTVRWPEPERTYARKVKSAAYWLGRALGPTS